MKTLILFLLKFISKPTNIIFLDLETNGLKTKSGILEIGALTLDNTDPFFETRVKLNFNSKWNEGAAAVHKISEEEARSKGKPIREALLDLSSYVRFHYDEEPIIAGFNPHFDLRVLEDAYDRLGIPFPFSHRVHDLNTLSRSLIGTDSSSASLEKLNIPYDSELKHSAVYDCTLARFVYEKL